MRVKFLLTGVCAGILALCVVIEAVAAEAVATKNSKAQIKIGFINTAQVLDESPQADEARKRIEKEFAPRDKKIVDTQNQVRKMEEKLTRDGAVMSEAERRKYERDIVGLKRDLKRETEEFREDLNIRRNEEHDRVRRLVREVIVNISEKQNYDLILEAGVVFASDKVDITGEVIKKLKVAK